MFSPCVRLTNAWQDGKKDAWVASAVRNLILSSALTGEDGSMMSRMILARPVPMLLGRHWLSANGAKSENVVSFFSRLDRVSPYQNRDGLFRDFFWQRVNVFLTAGQRTVSCRAVVSNRPNALEMAWLFCDA